MQQLYMSLYLNLPVETMETCAFTGFTVNSGPLYPSSGTYTSQPYDAGSSVSWTGLTWDATVPADTTLAVQVAVSDSATGPFTYVGPDGTSGTYFTTSGGSFPDLSGRYASYQATLGYASGSSSPTLSQVNMTYSGVNGSAVMQYGFDGTGNMVSKVTVSGNTTVTETRTMNTLNQITANTVGAGNTTTDWTYTMDLSGNVLTKTNVTTSETTTFVWDEDNRLVQVVLPGNVTIDYQVDSLERMISRTDSSGTAWFAWDGMDCVQELSPDGWLTNYYAPQGVLLGFERYRPQPIQVYGLAVYGTAEYWARAHYSVVTDALGSVRQVRDLAGNLVAQYDTDAWGNPLDSSFDNVPAGGLAYRWVGAYGVRWDAGTGLYYMRNRWYEPTLQLFYNPLPDDNAQVCIAWYPPMGKPRLLTLHDAFPSDNSTQTQFPWLVGRPVLDAEQLHFLLTSQNGVRFSFSIQGGRLTVL